MKWIRWVLVVVLAIPLVLVLAFFASQPQAIDKDSESFVRLHSGEFAVGTETLELVDKTRITQENGDQAQQFQRAFGGTVWFPIDEAAKIPNQRLPLVVYAHGFSSFHESGQYLAEHLAAHGYIVAAVNFPLTNLKAQGGPLVQDVVYQPGDLSFLIDSMLAKSRDKDSPFYRRIDRYNIGVAGLSLGGLTTALVSYHPFLSDERIKAAFAMAAPVAAFTAKFYQTNPELPFVLMAGTADYVVPYDANGEHYEKVNPYAWNITIDGGSHLGFANAGSMLRLYPNPDQPVCSFLKKQLKEKPIDSGWQKVMGDENIGIDLAAESWPCSQPLQDAIHPVRQQQLVKLSARAFFDSYLKSGAVAEQGQAFLRTALAREHEELSVTAPTASSLSHVDHP